MMQVLFKQGWNQLVLGTTWFCSLVFLYAYMDSRLTKVHREYAEIWRQFNSQKSRYVLSEQLDALAHPPESEHTRPTRTFNEENLLIIYNRVPKTASTSFMGIAYDLCKKNKFHALHLNISKNAHTMSMADQARFVKNVTNWTDKKPAIYHGHVAFVDFTKFGQSNPLYINLIRDPLERLISYYYFLRFGDDFRPHLTRRRQGNKETFDDCVERKGKDCDPAQMWVQIPFFCGHSAECWVPGSRWALDEAKKNLISHYLLVGVTEELKDFIALLEATLPRFFSGATQAYISGQKSHLRKTNKKFPPSQKTLESIQQSEIWQMEQSFYEFARKQFHFLKERTSFLDSSGNFNLPQQQFHYEKIKPAPLA